MEITATIITLNEEDNIEACIASAKQVCDEVIVVDSISRDDTREIARSAGAMVIEQVYLGDGPQKASGLSHAKNDWILSLDADERLEPETVERIKKLDLSNHDYMYAFRRRNYVGDKWIKAAGFYPDYVTRLYNRNTASYTSAKSHAKVSGAKVKTLPAHIAHYTYADFTHWISRINQLSSRDAWAKHEAGQRCSPAGAATRSVFAFLKKLLLKGGIFQGSDGWLIAITSAFHVYMKYMKLAAILEREKK